jgi:hypothetical protein
MWEEHPVPRMRTLDTWDALPEGGMRATWRKTSVRAGPPSLATPLEVAARSKLTDAITLSV